MDSDLDFALATAYYYAANVKGLVPGQVTIGTRDPYYGTVQTYATTNFAVARAFALNGERSIYLVQLDPPISYEIDVKQHIDTWFVNASGGTVLDVVEPDPHTTITDIREVMSRRALWASDGSPIYDDDGYANVPNVPRLKENPCSAADLRQLGRYPPPTIIWNLTKSLVSGISYAERAAVREPIGSAWLEQDGSITMRLVRTGDGIPADAMFTYKTSDEQYNYVLEHLGGLKPGEIKTVMPFDA